jgi:hypothetical protein
MWIHSIHFCFLGMWTHSGHFQLLTSSKCKHIPFTWCEHREVTPESAGWWANVDTTRRGEEGILLAMFQKMLVLRVMQERFCASPTLPLFCLTGNSFNLSRMTGLWAGTTHREESWRLT